MNEMDIKKKGHETGANGVNLTIYKKEHAKCEFLFEKC